MKSGISPQYCHYIFREIRGVDLAKPCKTVEIRATRGSPWAISPQTWANALANSLGVHPVGAWRGHPRTGAGAGRCLKSIKRPSWVSFAEGVDRQCHMTCIYFDSCASIRADA